jgi:probable rRNA maturation factor
VSIDVAIANRSGWTLDEEAAARVLQTVFAAERIETGDVGLALVDSGEMADLNGRHRGKPRVTDVLSFPIDGADPLEPGMPAQLGDVVVCPAYASEQGTAMTTLLVHGALHLVGYDHETDGGEMLDRQDQLLEEVEDVAVSARQ